MNKQTNIFTDSHAFKKCTNSNTDSYFVSSILKEKKKKKMATLIDTVNVRGDNLSLLNHGFNTMPRFLAYIPAGISEIPAEISVKDL